MPIHMLEGIAMLESQEEGDIDDSASDPLSYIILEDGSGFLLREDGTGFILKEDSV